LVIAGILLFSADVDLPVGDTPLLALPLILAGLVWGALEIIRRQTQASGNASEEERGEGH
jgi:hypothetical protein